MERKQVNVRLTKTIREQLRKFAYRKRRSTQDIIEAAIAQYLADEKSKEQKAAYEKRWTKGFSSVEDS